MHHKPDVCRSPEVPNHICLKLEKGAQETNWKCADPKCDQVFAAYKLNGKEPND